MKRKFSKRLTTLLTVIALLLLILPAGALFADSIANGDKKPVQTTTAKPEDNDEEEPDEQEPEETDLDEEEGEDAAEGEKSEQAILVANRIAEATVLGIPPGHLNLIDKLLAAYNDAVSEPIERDELLAALELTEWKDASVQQIMQEIKRLRFEAKGKSLPTDEEEVDEPTDGDIEPETESAEEPAKGNKANGQAKGKGNSKK